MRIFEAIRRRKRNVASVAGVVAVSLSVVTLASIYQGFTTADVELNDGGVWVTNSDARLVGHLNHPAKTLDSSLNTASGDFEVLQSGNTVVLWDRENSVIAGIDPADVGRTTGGPIPAGALVAFGGSTVAVLDPSDGSLYATTATATDSFTAEGVTPIAKLGEGAAVAVSPAGSVFAVSRGKSELVSFTVDSLGTPGPLSRTDIDGINAGSELSVTTVGEQAVVLDTAAGRIHLPGGGTASVEGAGARLQQAGAASDSVLIATPSALIEQPLSGGAAVSIAATGDGTPAAPVFVGSCAYSAWSGSSWFVRDCADDGNDDSRAIEGLTDDAAVEFRVNRSIVVLNELAQGNVYLVNDDMAVVSNWDEVKRTDESDGDEGDSTQESLEVQEAERTDENTVPVAVADTLGARPGRSTILPVIVNDYDQDGDLLTATLIGDQPAVGEVQAIFGGAALQLVLPDDATGDASFDYQIDDGRGGTAIARASVTISQLGENSPPEQTGTVPTLTVQLGATADVNVLGGWRDPDGDDLYLSSAASTDGSVTFTADGVVSFTASGDGPGAKTVTLSVSDGIDDPVEGTLKVDVLPVGAAKPIANGDLVTATVNEDVSVTPLANDLSPTGAQLRLVDVNDEVPDASITPDYAAASFTFRASRAGSFYVEYTITDSGEPVVGLVRVDVSDPLTEPLPPVAVRDVGLLPAGRSVLVDVLANDTDPNGGVLVVTSVGTAKGVSAAVLDHSLVRISDRALDSTVVVTYTISNGQTPVTGEILVIPVPATSSAKPPIAGDDTAIVRAGDIVTIDVLKNDRSQNGGDLTVEPILVEPVIAAGDGEVFVSENTVRFRAGATAKTVNQTYTITDDIGGQSDTGYLTISIVGSDVQNSPPRPVPVTARVIAGSTVRIPIALNGIDPEGDSVELVGTDVPPTKGAVVVGSDYLLYTALPTSVGTDVFSYKVRDRLGSEATATVRVGIAAVLSENTAPEAVPDSITVRTNRSVAVPVLANDSDPDGDTLTLVADQLGVPAGVTATVAGDRVVVGTTAVGEYSVQYGIEDSRKAAAQGLLQVTVTEDAPLLAPIARDDVVAASDIAGKTTIDVTVLENDDDLDGVASDLVVSVTDPAAVVRSKGVVRVTVAATAQIITYATTDVDGLTARAFIRVPGSGEQYPVLNANGPKVTVKSGEPVTIPIADHVIVASGKTAIIVDAIGATDGTMTVDSSTAVTYTSNVEFAGAAGVTVKVTDGTSPEDPAGRQGTITIPITVEPLDNRPPTVVGSTLTVAPKEPAKTIDLSGLATDPDDESLEFALDGAVPASLSARLEGSILEVSAADDAVKNTTASIGFSAKDATGEPVTAAIAVTITGSTLTPPRANDDADPRYTVDQGKSISVPVLDNDFNPYEGTEELHFVGALAVTGDAVAKIDGQQITVTANGTAHGSITVNYTIGDASNDAERTDIGNLTVQVLGRPDAPERPTITDVGNATAVVSWREPPSNGSPISGYTITASPGGATTGCAQLSCPVTGLKNGTPYTFTVTATNAVDDSDASPASAPVTPDKRPDTPAPPTLVFGDKQLDVSWVTPGGVGTAVKGYTLEISPAASGGVSTMTVGAVNKATWPNLENGVAYQVRIQASNDASSPSDFSAFSATQIPAGVPEAPAKPTVERLDPVGGQARIRVNWIAPSSNGDEIATYTVTSSGGAGSVSQSVAGGVTSADFNVDVSTTDYAFSVVAHNKAGDSAASAKSDAIRGYTAPGEPTNVSAAPGDNRVTVTWGAAPGNGSSASEISYRYAVNGGSWQNDWVSGGTGTTGVIGNGAVNNNGTYTITIRAVSSLGNTPGASSAASNAVAPFGAVGTPTAGASNAGQQVALSWGSPSRNGRDFATEIRIDGGGWEPVGASGSRSVGSWSQDHSIEVRVTDTEGSSKSASASARSSDQPAPTQWTRTLDVSQSCAQDQLTTSRYSTTGPSCSAPGYWIAARSVVTVTCFTDSATLSSGNNNRWYRMTNNFYVSQYTLQAGEDTKGSEPSGMPTC